MNFLTIFVAFMLTGVTIVISGIGLVSAYDESKYPPMSMNTNKMTPPPAPAFNRSYPQYYPPQNYPPQYSQPAKRSYPPQIRGYGRPVPSGRHGQYAGGQNYGYGSPYPGQYGPRSRPWNNGGYSRGPWGGNRNFGNGMGSNRGPYGNNAFGNMFGRNGLWGMRPDEWMTTNPEDGFSYMWDDMINAPSEMGEMPGGWNAPSVSVPNPVEIGSELRKEAPNLVREIPDMINIR